MPTTAPTDNHAAACLEALLVTALNARPGPDGRPDAAAQAAMRAIVGMADGGEEEEAPQQYAREGKGSWITIGGHKGEDGKRHGGSPVYVEGGKITKGAPSLAGKKVGNLKEDAEPEGHRKQLHREKQYRRATWAKKARAEGVDAEGLHALAADLHAHGKAFAEQHNAHLGEARKLARHYGLNLSHLSRAFKDGDADQLKHFDEVAAVVGPEMFPSADESEWGGLLFDALTAGNREHPAEEDAYEQALEHLRGQGASAPEQEEEAVPFARDGDFLAPLRYEGSEEEEDDEPCPHSLAGHYAEHWNALTDAGYTPSDEDLEDAGRELEGTDAALWRDPDSGVWEAIDVSEGEGKVEYAQERAPKGGITIGGKKYAGGTFVPASVVAQATPEEKEKLEASHKQATARRQARGSVDAGKLKDSLKGHADAELEGWEARQARRAYNALRQHHGAYTLHRIEELAHDTQQALAGLDADDPEAEGLRAFWSKRLRTYHDMLGWAEGHGITGKAKEEEKAPEEAQEKGAAKAVPGDQADEPHQMTRADFLKHVWTHGAPKGAPEGIAQSGWKRGEFAPPGQMQRGISYGWSKQGLNAVEASAMNRGEKPIPPERHGVVFFGRKTREGEKSDHPHAPLKIFGHLPYADAAEDPHRAFVAQALATGLPVPPEVLADYPDLAKPAEAPAPKPAVAPDAETGGTPRRSRKVADVLTRAATAMGHGEKTVHKLQRGGRHADMTADGTVYVYSNGILQQQLFPDGRKLYPGVRDDLDSFIAEVIETAPAEARKNLAEALKAAGRPAVAPDMPKPYPEWRPGSPPNPPGRGFPERRLGHGVPVGQVRISGRTFQHKEAIKAAVKAAGGNPGEAWDGTHWTIPEKAAEQLRKLPGLTFVAGLGLAPE